MGLKLLMLSNGHGEDAIGALLARHLTVTGAPIEVWAFPLVGTGDAYRRQGIPVVGVQRSLPSGGFARLGWRQFGSDVRAGLFRLLVRQGRALRRLRGTVDVVMAVGDIIPLLMGAWFARLPMAFYSTAKSDFIREHFFLEKAVMRRYCQRVFTRDERTARSLARAGVPAMFCGNLMMDMIGTEPLEGLGLPQEAAWVVMLPGSREDAYDNLVDMLEAVPLILQEGPPPAGSDGARDQWAFAVALAPNLALEPLAARAGAAGWRWHPAPGEEGGTGSASAREAPAGEEGSGAGADAQAASGPTVAGRLHRDGAEVWLVRNAFGGLLRQAHVCIGTAGTANEQAVGLGIPVVAFPGRGWQFTPRFLAAQKRLLGDGLLPVPREPGAIAGAVRRAVGDAALREQVRQAGRERMGDAGGAARMARELLGLWGLEAGSRPGEQGEGAPRAAGDTSLSLDASVVIPTYNNAPVLNKVLHALAHQTYPPHRFEVVVVDDGSTDATPEMVRRFSAPFPLRYVRQRNRGRSAARNRGVHTARADLIIFLDSDIIVEDQFVEAHVGAHRRAWEEGRRLVVNGPVIHTENFDDPRSEKPRWTDMSRAFFATGNASVARADLLLAGLFDEDFREYGWEDLELGDRLRDLGLESVTEPLARGFHLQQPPQVAFLPARLEKERQRGRSALLYYRKRPTFAVRAKLQLLWPFFVLDRVMTLGGFLTEERMWHLLQRWEEGGRTGLVRFWSKVLLQHAYMEGLREGLRQGSASPKPAK